MSIYGPRKFQKIHSSNDTDLEKRFKSYITFWGSLGYLARNEMLENNEREIDSKQLKRDIETMGSFYSNDKARADFSEQDLNNFNRKRNLCRTMFKNIKEEDFSNTLNSFLISNVYKNLVAIKLLTPRFDSKIGINSLNKIEHNYWMSFTVLPNKKLADVIKRPLNFVPESSIGATAIFEFLIIQLPLGFKYVPTNNLCDINEIIINSNEILSNKNAEICFITV